VALRRASHLGYIIALCALVTDRVSKWWIIDILDLPERGRVVLLPFLNLRWAENRGVSFSLLTADSEVGRWGLVAATLLIVAGLGFWLRTVQDRLLALAIGLVMGGALGNIYDRAVFGYVADFVQFYIGSWSFAIFNVADSCITLGAALLIWDAFFGSTSVKNSGKVK